MKEFEKLEKSFIPENLTEQELEIWNRVADQLIEVGILNSVNYLMLIRYCSVSVQLNNYLHNKPNHTSTIKALSKEVKQLEDDLCLSPTTYNKFLKDRLIIEDRQKKLGNKAKTTDEYKESFFKE